MAYLDNPVLPLYEPGERITAAVTAAVTAGKFVKPSGNFQAGPLLDVSTPTGPLVKGNLPQVATCTAGAKAIGVSGWDCPTVDDVCGLICGPGIVVPMVAGNTIVAGNEVQSDAAGLPIPWDGTLASARNGIALNGGAGAATVYIRLYT